MSKSTLRAELEAHLREANSIDGFTLLHYADQAMDVLGDAELAKEFVIASENAINTKDSTELAHPCDLGEKIYAFFKDAERADKAFKNCLAACKWDSESVKEAERDWTKKKKKFK